MTFFSRKMHGSPPAPAAKRETSCPSLNLTHKHHNLHHSSTTQLHHCKIDATTQMLQIMHVITMVIIIPMHNLTHLSVTWTDAPFEIKHSIASA